MSAVGSKPARVLGFVLPVFFVLLSFVLPFFSQTTVGTGSIVGAVTDLRRGDRRRQSNDHEYRHGAGC